MPKKSETNLVPFAILCTKWMNSITFHCNFL
nr:MAG TPA: hypothetical protein [Caudoviricetes sp.]